MQLFVICVPCEPVNSVTTVEKFGCPLPDKCTTSQRSKSGGEIESDELAVQMNST